MYDAAIFQSLNWGRFTRFWRARDSRDMRQLRLYRALLSNVDGHQNPRERRTKEGINR